MRRACFSQQSDRGFILIGIGGVSNDNFSLLNDNKVGFEFKGGRSVIDECGIESESA